MKERQYIRSTQRRDHCIYSVYNSQSQLMLYTTNRQLAESIAEAFKRNPQTTHVIVAEQDPRVPKRV